MTLREKLNSIANDLKPIRKESILQQGIDTKLGRSQRKYQEAIEQNCRYILSRNNHKVLMAIDRYNRRKEKENNDEKEDKYGFVEVI